MTEPAYEGSPKVGPENKHKINGRPILGWVTFQVTAAGEKIRRSIELFMPSKVPEGFVAKPLVLGEELPFNVNGPAPEVKPPLPPAAPRLINIVAATPSMFDEDKLKELRRTCNINRNQGANLIDIAYVLSCLEPK